MTKSERRRSHLVHDRITATMHDKARSVGGPRQTFLATIFVSELIECFEKAPCKWLCHLQVKLSLNAWKMISIRMVNHDTLLLLTFPKSVYMMACVLGPTDLQAIFTLKRVFCKLSKNHNKKILNNRNIFQLILCWCLLLASNHKI